MFNDNFDIKNRYDDKINVHNSVICNRLESHFTLKYNLYNLKLKLSRIIEKLSVYELKMAIEMVVNKFILNEYVIIFLIISVSVFVVLQLPDIR